MQENELEAYAKEAGVKLYDSEIVNENGKRICRIYIIKENEPINLDDCTRLSEILSPIFDVRPPVKGEYYLEVSSVGLERKLTKLKHFALSINEKVKITTYEKEKFEAEILGVEAENILLKNSEKDEFKIKFSEIKKARVFVEW